MRVIGYAWCADTHCVGCTRAAAEAGRLAVTGLGYNANESGEDEHGLAYALADSEGNTIGAILSTDEGSHDESGRELTTHCGDCGAIIRQGDPAAGRDDPAEEASGEDAPRWFSFATGNGNDGVGHSYPDSFVRIAPRFAYAFLEEAALQCLTDEGRAIVERDGSCEVEGDAEYGLSAVILNPPEDDSADEDEDSEDSEDSEDEDSAREERESMWSDHNGAWFIAELHPCEGGPHTSARAYDNAAEYLGADAWAAICDREADDCAVVGKAREQYGILHLAERDAVRDAWRAEAARTREAEAARKAEEAAEDRATILRLAMSERRAYRRPGAPRCTLAEAMSKARTRAEGLKARGGVGAYDGTPFGMFRDGDYKRRHTAGRGRPSRFMEREEAESMLRMITSAEDRRAPRVYHADPDHCGAAYSPHVARIGTARRDVTNGAAFGLWVALAREEESGEGGFIAELGDVFSGDCEEAPRDAIRAAHRLAEGLAESEADYQSGWRDGGACAEELNAAQDSLSAEVAKARTLRERERRLIADAARLAMLADDESIRGIVAHLRADAAQCREDRAALCDAAREEWRDAMRKAENDSPVSLARLAALYSQSGDEAGNYRVGFAHGFRDSRT